MLLPVRSETPRGNVRYRRSTRRPPEPAADPLHAWGGWAMAPTAAGTAATYHEDYLYNSRIIAPNQVLALVSEGVFDRYPALRVLSAQTRKRATTAMIRTIRIQGRAVALTTRNVPYLPDQRHYPRMGQRTTSPLTDLPMIIRWISDCLRSALPGMPDLDRSPIPTGAYPGPWPEPGLHVARCRLRRMARADSILGPGHRPPAPAPGADGAVPYHVTGSQHLWRRERSTVHLFFCPFTEKSLSPYWT